MKQDPVDRIRGLAAQFGANLDKATGGLPPGIFAAQKSFLRGIQTTTLPPHLRKILEQAQKP